MAISFEELQEVVKKTGINYFVHPDKSQLLFGAAGPSGKYHCIISLELEGRFLQIRTAGYLYCPADHPHLAEVLKILGAVNYRARLAKFGWDPTDGEICAFADLWLVDNSLTQEQWERMLENYLSVIDLTYHRLRRTLETGQDPGEEKPEDLMQRLLGESGLPKGLRDLLEEIRKKLGGGGPSEEGGGEEITSI